MNLPISGQTFETLKLKVYQRGVLLGALATAVITLIWRLGDITIEFDDLMVPVMCIYCLASYITFRILGSRFLRIFETSAIIILLAFFLLDFAWVIWRDARLPVFNFGAILLWLPVLYIVSFLIFRSSEALGLSLGFFACILIIGGAYFIWARSQPVNWANVELLAQVYASNLLYIATLYIIALLKDRYGEAESRSEVLKNLAMLDDLTGIHNRRRIDDLLNVFIQDYRISGKPFSIIMLDVDDLKKINDTYGHDSGDVMLKRVAQVLRQNVRESDHVGRWGGDEFFVLYPDTDKERVQVLTGRLIAALGGADFHPVSKLTLSQGSATCEPQDTAASLWKRADEALYLAKRARNMAK